MLKNKPSSTSPSRGFTIVEMLIIAPIVLLTIGAFVTVIVNMTGDVLATRSSNVLAYSIQDALNRIEDDIKLSTTFLEANNVSLTGSHQGFDDNVANFANVDNGTTTNGDMLILNTLATTGNPLSSSSGLVYLTGQPNACGATQNQNTPMTMNVIYFVKNNTLWRRSIMPSNYAAGLTVSCNAPWQQPSCAPGVTDSFCKTQDVRLVDGINPSDFVVQYFNTADATAANSAAVDPTSASNRHVALQSTQTASATINTGKTVAGRQISQAGTMRATRLDINSSTIADVVTPTTPVAPTVTGMFLAPDSAKFTWPAVPGANSYTIQYNINGGAWLAATTCTSGTSCTISPLAASTGCVVNACTVNPSLVRTNVVNVRVTAVNTAGSTTSAVATVTIPPWNGIVFSNNWGDYGGGYATGTYTKTSDGMVVLKGLVKRVGTAVLGETIGTLPAGYRPSERLIFQTSTSAAPSIASRIDIDTNGAIILSSGDGGWVSMNNINFLPSGSPYTFNALTPLYNGWVIYGSPPWAAPAYAVDGSGRVHTKGLVGGGTVASGTLIVYIPVAARPPQYMHIVADVNGANGMFGIQATDGNLHSKGYGNSYVSLQSVYFPVGYGGWSNLTLQNGWIFYGGQYATPQYTKAADGMVHLKGLISTGTTASGTVIANLPVGYRPKETILYGIERWALEGRIDIFPNGDVVARVVDAGWTSLDNITFMSEQ